MGCLSLVTGQLFLAGCTGVNHHSHTFAEAWPVHQGSSMHYRHLHILVCYMQTSQHFSPEYSWDDYSLLYHEESILHVQGVSDGPVGLNLEWSPLSIVWPSNHAHFPEQLQFAVDDCGSSECFHYVTLQ